MTKYLNFFESESGFTEAVGAGQLFFPNVSYTEEDDTVHWNLARSVETPMLRMSFSTSTPGQEVALHRGSDSVVTAMEIDGSPVNFASGGTYTIAEPGNHTAVYQFTSSTVPVSMFGSESGAFDTFTSVEIISPVTSIGHHAFSNCSGLSSVSISDSVTVIGSHAFSGCSSLSSVTIPDSVTIIGDGVFPNCQSLQSVVLPDNLTVIKDSTFFGCQSLQSMVLPDNLTAIQSSAFFGCSSLYDINIPSGVTTIGQHAFLNCSGLTAIYLNPETPPTLGANALDNTNDCPIYVPAASVETYKQVWPAYASRIKTKHRITASVNDDSLGRVRLNQETASEGDHVEFDVEVFEEDVNQVLSVAVTDGNGDEVECNEDWDNHYSFDMPASDVTILVTIGDKPKHTVTVDSTDGHVTDVNFMSDDGQPSYKEGDMVNFTFNLPGDGQFYAASVQASDCDGNSIEVELEDEGDGHYSCYFTMPGCDASVFVTVEERPMYSIMASVNDDSLGAYDGPGSAPEGGQVEFNVFVFDPDANQVTSVTVTDGNGNNVEYSGRVDADYTHWYMFTMPASDVSAFITIEKKQ